MNIPGNRKPKFVVTTDSTLSQADVERLRAAIQTAFDDGGERPAADRKPGCIHRAALWIVAALILWRTR